MEQKTRLRTAITSKFPNLRDFSDRFDVNYHTLQHYLAGRRDPSTSFLKLLSEQVGLSASWILSGLGSMEIVDPGQIVNSAGAETVHIPHLDIEASAGAGSAPGEENVLATYSFDKSWLRQQGLNPENLSIISVSGDSMEPDLEDGDLIIVDRRAEYVRDGHVYIVRFADELFIKRVQKNMDGSIRLLSSNKAYDPIIVSSASKEGIHVVGKLVGALQKW